MIAIRESGAQDRRLRQTLVALRAGTRLDAGDRRVDGATGDLMPIPDARHSLEAVEDSTILLTVAKRP